MNTAPTILLDQADPKTRPQKAVWRQIREALSVAISDVLRGQPCEPISIRLISSDSTLAAAVSKTLGRAVGAAHAADSFESMHDDVVAVTLPEVGKPESRIALLRNAFNRTRPTGGIVVAATVVTRPGEDRRLTVSIRQLLEEINVATGAAIHIDAIQSIRWTNEPFVRGVILTITSLGTAAGEQV